LLNKALRDSLEFVYNSVFVELFNVKGKESISLCQWYIGYLAASYILDLKIINFQTNIAIYQILKCMRLTYCCHLLNVLISVGNMCQITTKLSYQFHIDCVRAF